MISRKSIVLAGTTALGLLVSGAADAQDFFSGLYVSGGLGGNFLDDITVTPDDAFYNPRFVDFDTGFAGSLALGARINPYFRVEGELSYRENDLDSVTVQNEGPQSSVGGDATAFAVMLNGWLDVPVGTGFITPYVGGGIGGANVSIEAGPDNPGPCGPACGFDGSDFVFSYQLGAGVAIGAAGGPQVTIDYRYFNADDINVDFPGPSGTSSEYEAQSVMIGFRMPLGGRN